MVKLIRITSEDNGNYNASLQDGIQLGSNSSIALQNLTAETLYETLNIVGANDTITSNLDTTQFTSVESALTNKQYTNENQTDFFTDLEVTLNDTLRNMGNTADFVNAGDVMRAINIDYPNKTPISKDMVELQMRYTPVIMPLFRNDDKQTREGTTQEIFNAHISLFYDTGPTTLLEDIGNMRLQTGIAATPARTHYITTVSDNMFLSRGSGIWGCRLQNLIDNIGPSDQNGYGIGLSFNNVNGPYNTQIPNTDRDFEIRCQKVADNYVFITPTVPNTPQDTGIAPYSMTTPVGTGTGGTNNDQMVFWKDGANLHLQIWNKDGAAQGKVAWEVVYVLSKEEQAKPLYPYLYICGSSPGDITNDNIVGQPYFTADPFMAGNDNYEVTGHTQSINGGDSIFDLVNMTAVKPFLDNDRFDGYAVQTQKYLWRMSNVVWNHVGVEADSSTIYYDYNPIPQINTWGNGELYTQLRILISANNSYSILNSDNYVVVIDSNPVMSYDASRFNYGAASNIVNTYNEMRGRQLNILATIPVNDNNGILEYQSNELVYIDLDNRFPLELKNLRLRLLNKYLEPVATKGLSVMTLLIKDQ